jgi:hypothetical protein
MSSNESRTLKVFGKFVFQSFKIKSAACFLVESRFWLAKKDFSPTCYSGSDPQKLNPQKIEVKVRSYYKKIGHNSGGHNQNM